jgi:glycerophosphoryl diester phosphodiesterase
MSGSATRPPAPRSGLALLAHRGASHAAPENTLRAFRLAVEEEADGIELDVRLSADEVPVVFHDDDLARMTGVSGRVSATAWETLRTLDVAGERIPELADVVAFARRHPLALNVELKPSPRPLALVEACLPHLLLLASTVDLVVSSFDPRALALLHARAPAIRLALIFDDVRALAALPMLPAVDLHPRHDLLSPERARDWQGAARRVRVWTVDDRDEARRLLALEPGLAALITNRPGPLRSELMEVT